MGGCDRSYGERIWENDLKQWKQILFEVEMTEFEERVGFKSMEQNAGVWDERWK